MIPSKRVSVFGETVAVSRETRRRLEEYGRLLVQWQSKINLVAPSTLDNIWERHLLDSLQLADCLDGANDVMDIGSGAGFPGLVLAMVLAEGGSGRVRLVESNGKKCAFMNAVVRETGLRQSGVDVPLPPGSPDHQS